jgi:hypothetical protein
MVYELPIPLAHTARIDHNDMPLLKVVHGKDLPYGRRPSKKSRSQRSLNPSNTIPKEMNAIITNENTIEGANN